MKMKHIVVWPYDIHQIGHTSYPDDDGNTRIICSGDTARVEGILLREVLEAIGPEFKIITSGDFITTDHNGEDHYDIEFMTNLPWEIYDSIQSTHECI